MVSRSAVPTMIGSMVNILTDGKWITNHRTGSRLLLTFLTVGGAPLKAHGESPK